MRSAPFPLKVADGEVADGEVGRRVSALPVVLCFFR
mgnify:CR=1 FL=1